MMGPGDILAINLWSELDTDFTLSITPEGTILVPTVGVIDLNGLTLRQAKEKISASVLDRYRKTSVTVTLLNTRTFQVSVAGAIYAPGVYTAHATDRVSTVVEKAGGLIGFVDFEDKTLIPSYLADLPKKKSTDDQTKEKMIILPKASKRAISLKRRDGTIISVDLLKYERTGSLEANPRVLDGDVVVIPVMEKTINTYGIFGAVRAPGFLEYSEGERVSDLIAIANGLTLNADSSSAQLIRFGGDKISTFLIDLNLISILGNPGGADDLLLRPDDRVFIKSIESYHDKLQVKIEGEVRFPGTYWIESDSVMLSKVLSRAGNPTEYADLSRAEMIRESGEFTFDPEFERLKKMQVDEMTQSEYEYFKMRSREKAGRVSINLVKLLKEKNHEYDIPLRPSDEIFIPRQELTVSVTGQVRNPGLVPFLDGASIDYYVSKAGGYSERAREGKVRIIRGSTGEWIKPSKKHHPQAGDIVMVPEKLERHYWQMTRDALFFAGNLATVYLVVRQATK